MQRLTRTSFIGSSLLVLALAVSACSSDPEETPDITEAIPLDVDPEGEASAAGSDGALADRVELSGKATSGDTPALPGGAGNGSGDGSSEGAGAGAGGGSGAGVTRGQQALPDTMETGSNRPGFEPPKGSKVQRFN